MPVLSGDSPSIVAVRLVGAFERLDDLHRVRQDVPAGEDLMERLGELLGHVRHVRALEHRIAQLAGGANGPAEVAVLPAEAGVALGVAEVHLVDVEQPVGDRVAHDLQLRVLQPVDDEVGVRIVLAHVDLADVEDQREALMVADLGGLEHRDGLAAPLLQVRGLAAAGDDLAQESPGGSV